MNNPIRIAQILAKMDFGGIEAVVLNYFRNIDKEKFKFDFIIFEDSICPFESEILKNGGRIYRVPNIKNILKYNLKLKEIFLNNKYDIVHCHMNTLSVFPLRIAKKCGIKVRISHSHSSSSKNELVRNLVKNFLKLFSKTYATSYIACSKLAAEWQFGKSYVKNNKVLILNNAIDIKKFSYNNYFDKEVRKEYNLENSFVFGHVGRFVTQKNHFFIIDFFEKVRTHIDNAKLLLVGDGPLFKEVINYVHLKGLKDYVVFTGNVNETYKFYNAMDIFILPSLYEGLPVVGIEAQCNGLPCIFSKNISSEVLINHNSKMVELKLDEWVKSIDGLSRINSEFENSKFDIHYQSHTLEKMYNSLLEK